jgi:hypothetical protein
VMLFEPGTRTVTSSSLRAGRIVRTLALSGTALM